MTRLGRRLRWGNNFTQAWFASADALLPNSQVARILAEDNAYFYDTWANHTSPTTVDNTFYWWTHRAGTAQGASASNVNATTTVWGANKVDVASLDGEMPVYLVAPLSLEAAEGQFEQVGNAFGLTDTTPISSLVASDVFGPNGGGNEIFVNSDGSLLMDASAGNYLYTDPDRLWSEAAVVQGFQAADAQSVHAITSDDAITIANSFLEQTGLMLSDATQPYVTSDVISGGADPTRYTGASAAEAEAYFQALADVTTNYKVNYDRVLTYEPPFAAGAAAAISFSVVGPGPKLSVYVAPTAPVTITAAGGQSSVLGGQGGWRQASGPG